MQHLLEEKGLGAWLISIALTSREQALGSCFSNGAGGGGGGLGTERIGTQH